jgi:hypothetical protein
MGLHCGVSLGKWLQAVNAIRILLRIATTIARSTWLQRWKRRTSQRQIFMKREGSLLRVSRLRAWKHEFAPISSIICHGAATLLDWRNFRFAADRSPVPALSANKHARFSKQSTPVDFEARVCDQESFFSELCWDRIEQ